MDRMMLEIYSDYLISSFGQTSTLCRGQNSVNPVWDGSLTFVKATEMSIPLGCFYDERTPEPTLSR